MSRRPVRRRPVLRRLVAATEATAAVEFAIILPILMLLLAGITDLGGALLVRFRLDAAAAAAANYAMVKAGSVTSAAGGALAGSIAALARTDAGISAADVTVVVNNGPTATATGTGSIVVTNATGSAALPADLCYCPGASPFSWGGSATCGSACPAGGMAGKFVAITLSRPYAALFSSYGFISGDAIVATAIVQTR